MELEEQVEELKRLMHEAAGYPQISIDTENSHLKGVLSAHAIAALEALQEKINGQM